MNGVGAFVGLGANLGDAAATLHAALRELDVLPQTRLRRASRLYRTPAWGGVLHEGKPQPDYLNAVAEVTTRLTARELLDGLLAIERRHGRDRRREQRWGPRTLDLDLLLHGDAQIDDASMEAGGLRVPHPLMHRRAFVLLPLLEIAPEAVIPGFGPARNAVSALETGELSNIVPLSVDNARP
ncbi:MAG: 2-amino-4-hydroxy-6-hydroxymethyldihydropteridine diphosphokinase [Pseudoxanthomonas sp.]